MDLLKMYLSEPTLVNKFKIIDMLKDTYNPNTKLIKRLMIFNLMEKDPHLEIWFLNCIKSLIVDPNTLLTCPDGYEDIFDDDSHWERCSQFVTAFLPRRNDDSVS